MPIIIDVQQIRDLQSEAETILNDIQDALYVINNAANILGEKEKALQEIRQKLDTNRISFISENEINTDDAIAASNYVGSGIEMLKTFVSRLRRSEEYYREYYEEDKKQVKEK